MFIKKILSRSKNSKPTQLETLINWTPLTMKDVYKERGPIQYVAEKLFEIPSVNIVYGSPGSLKSFLLADLAACVVSGNVWLQPLAGATGNGISVAQYPVVWIDYDNGKRRTLDRFKAIALALGIPVDSNLTIFSSQIPVLSIGNRGHISQLKAKLMEQGAKLLVIDNLGAISGGVDENSSEMASLFGNLRLLADEVELAIIIIHHRRKSDSTGRQGDVLRGHSSIEAALDLALLVERTDQSLYLEATPTKVRGSEVESFSAQFVYENDSDGNLYKARFYRIATAKDAGNPEIMRGIEEALSGGSKNQSKLIEATHEILKSKHGKNKIRDVIDAMVSQDYLKQSSGPNNAKIYSLNPEKPLE